MVCPPGMKSRRLESGRLEVCVLPTAHASWVLEESPLLPPGRGGRDGRRLLGEVEPVRLRALLREEPWVAQALAGYAQVVHGWICWFCFQGCDLLCVSNTVC